jgi:asparagine N-glycosylation enzyme membrane subunit Stt3
MFGVLASILIAFLSLFVPGVLLSFVLLRKTELHTFEIVFIGIIFGLIAPATMTWMESYLMNYIHFFSFSMALFEVNSVVLTLIGLALAYRDGMLHDFVAWVKNLFGIVSNPGIGVSKHLDGVRSGLSKYERGREVILKHQEEERALRSRQQSEFATATFKADEKQIMAYQHKDALAKLMKGHLSEERALTESLEGSRFRDTNTHWIVWAVLLVLILLTFYTRILNISIAPKFFEFDPYFDMIDAHYVLAYGQQLLLDPSAWPVVAAGTNHRIEPIVPYLEAYWYSLANAIKFHYSTFNTSLMAYVGSIYPPITAALLVFVVFVLLYHEYDEKIGLIGAGLAATMPTLISTFIAGEQLVEPWGIMTLFFFIMAYMLAVRNMKDKRLAILAGIGFVSTFLGAHYYTVTTGVLALYIVIQGCIETVRGHDLKDFYKMNAVVLGIIAIFLVVFLPYSSTLENRIPTLLGLPFTIAAPLYALVLIFVLEYLVKMILPRLKNNNANIPKMLITMVGLLGLGVLTYFILSTTFFAPLIIVILPIWAFAIFLFALAITKRLQIESDTLWRATILVALAAIALAVMFITPPIRHSLNSYINLSAKFTTPSIPLFMTVQEYAPTGLLYNFAAAGFGPIGNSIILFIVCDLAIFVILLSMLYRKSKTGVLYLAIAAPLMMAGFIEVKYLPHFGVAYLVLFGILLGELLYLTESKWKLSNYGKQDKISPAVYQNMATAAYLILMVGAFFIIGAIAAILFMAFAIYMYFVKEKKDKAYAWIIGLGVILLLVSILPAFRFGESSAAMSAISASTVVSGSPNINAACSTFANRTNSFGSSIYCNLIPQYWLSSMAWISQNVGPTGPRVLAWWDYGDWINWFGKSNAVLRGDNANAIEDYAIAAKYVLGPKYGATPQALENLMNGNQTKYVLFDQDLISKWGALDFLGCINANATSLQYAIQQGKSENPSQPYALGTSACEQSHDPQYAAVPLSIFQSSASQSNINDYCSITGANALYVNTYLIVGQSLSNQSVCTELPYQTTTQASQNGVLQLFNSNGTKMNAVIQESQYLGVQDIQNTPYVLFLVIYLPDANGTIRNAPSQFYDSNFYRGFFTGQLPGFRQVYPNYTVGTNFINFSQAVRIYEVVNYTGGTPKVPSKPAWITNNDVMP